MSENLYEINNWVELNTKSDQPRYSEFAGANGYVKDYEALYNTFILDRSEFSQDDNKTGGDDCESFIVRYNKIVFKGKIDWYEKDESKGLEEGNRVGIKIKPALTVDDYPNLKVKIGTKIYDKTIFDGGVLVYTPNVTPDSKRFKIEIDWDGVNVERFVIEIMPGTYLKSKDETTV